MLLTQRIILWANRWWYSDVKNAKLLTEWWCLQVRLWYSTRGFLWTIAHIKSIRLHVTRYISGHPLLEPHGSFKISEDGLPLPIEHFFDHIRGDSLRSKSWVLTLLMISRCLPGTKKPDTLTITKPSKFRIPDGFADFIDEFIKNNKLGSFESTFQLTDLRFSTRSGPVGLSTVSSILQSYFAKKLLAEDLINITGGQPKGFMVNGRAFQPLSPLMKIFDKWAHIALRYQSILLKRISPSSRPHLVSLLRRLSIVNDPEGKARIICIFDYFSQSALRPLHNWLLSSLRTIPMDRTYDQDPFRIKQTGPYYSIDLTAATDRFPIEAQRLLLEKLTSEQFSRSWVNIMTAQPVYVPWEDQTVFYAAGQPMGAYSSWAMFTLTHHLVVQYSASKVGIPYFTDYMLLGDDIVIANKKVADSYLETLRILDVDTSESKSHVSEHTYEFAKRWIHHGHEISPLPLKGLLQSWNRYHLMVPLIYSIFAKLTPGRYCTVPDLFADLLSQMGFQKRHIKNLRNQAEKFSAIWRWMKNGDPSKIYELIIRFDNEFHPFPSPDSSDSKEYLGWLFERTLMREIINQIEELESYRTKILSLFSSLIDPNGLIGQIMPDLKFDLEAAIFYHPVVISITTESTEYKEKADKLVKDRDWLSILKMITLQNPDELLLGQRKDLVSQSVAKFAQELFKIAAMQRKKDTWFLSAFD